LELANGQRLIPISPQPSYSEALPAYTTNRTTEIIATIEHVQGRYWADFASQLLLLSVGALLGGTAFRTFERNREDK
jgi:hypothetical protein